MCSVATAFLQHRQRLIGMSRHVARHAEVHQQAGIVRPSRRRARRRSSPPRRIGPTPSPPRPRRRARPGRPAPAPAPAAAHRAARATTMTRCRARVLISVPSCAPSGRRASATRVRSIATPVNDSCNPSGHSTSPRERDRSCQGRYGRGRRWRSDSCRRFARVATASAALAHDADTRADAQSGSRTVRRAPSRSNASPGPGARPAPPMVWFSSSRTGASLLVMTTSTSPSLSTSPVARPRATSSRENSTAGLRADVAKGSLTLVVEEQVVLTVRHRLAAKALDDVDGAVDDDQIEAAVVVVIEPVRAESRHLRRRQRPGPCARARRRNCPWPSFTYMAWVSVAMLVTKRSSSPSLSGSPSAMPMLPSGRPPRIHRRARQEPAILEGAVSLIDPDLIGHRVVGDVDVGPAVAVEVADGDTQTRAVGARHA